jgi:hypothetical protein
MDLTELHGIADLGAPPFVSLDGNVAPDVFA